MSEDGAPSWRPDASLAMLQARARLQAAIRSFFAEREVLEVDTPVLSKHATVDRHIESFATADGRWLQTSPEFAMKRLLAAGAGAIYQIAHVFRREEAGRHHNPEFSMLEWYRPGWDHRQLMDEVEALLRALGSDTAGPYVRLSYREAFLAHAGIDPFAASDRELCSAAAAAGYQARADEGRDALLDLLMFTRVAPGLGVDTPAFVYDYPASQAALARVREGAPPLAERFELFWRGIELANGFHELGDADEQRRRFEADQAWRRAQGRSVPPYDRYLVEALAAGFPDCAGVAVGLDRLLMLLHDQPSVAATMSFSSRRA